jgi:hypothetical protein
MALIWAVLEKQLKLDLFFKKKKKTALIRVALTKWLKLEPFLKWF